MTLRTLITAVFAAILTAGCMGNTPGTPGGYSGHMGGMPFGGFGMILLVAAIGLIIWMTMRGSAGRDRKEKTSLDILKERYARGEIDHEEFEQIKSKLEE
jgi:putative membrane protein